MSGPFDARLLGTLIDPRRSPGDAAAWIAALLGPVHRLAWEGPDEAGHRARCLDLLQSMVASCQEGDDDARCLATFVDWWLHVSQGAGTLGLAFQVEEVLPDPLLSEPMSRLASAGATALRERRRPRAFVAEVDAFAERLKAQPHFSKSPGPELYNEARDEGQQLVQLARQRAPRDRVPALRLLEDDVEDWASEARGTLALDRQLKVWNSLVKHLQSMQQHARRLVELWTTGSTQPSGLPADWADRLAALGGPYTPLLQALLLDLAELDEDPPTERGAPLRPEATLGLLSAATPDLDEPLRVRMVAVVEEARARADRPAPAWVEQTLARLDELRVQIRTLRSEALELGVDDAVQPLDEALASLQRFEPGDTEVWVRFAEDELRKHRRDIADEVRGRDIAQLRARLEELGIGALAQAPGEDPAGWLARLEALHRDEKARLLGELERLRAAHVPRPVRPRVEALLDEARRRLQRDALVAAKRALDEAGEVASAHRDAEVQRLLPAVRALQDHPGVARLRGEERDDFEALAARITRCAQEGLSVEELLDAAQELVQAAADGALDTLPVLIRVDPLPPLQRQHPVRLLAWERSGVRVASSQRLPHETLLHAELEDELEADMLRVVRCGPGWVGPDGRTLALLGPPRAPSTGRWHDVLPLPAGQGLSTDAVLAYAGSHDLSATVFLATGGDVLGPYQVDDETAPKPADPRGFVARLERAEFDALFGTLEVRTADGPPRSLVHHAPDLATLLDQEAVPEDQVEAEHLQVWLADLDRDLGPDGAARLARAVAALQAGGQPIPAPLLERRLQALAHALATARAFERARLQAAESFLSTAQGRALLESVARRRVEELVEQRKEELDRRIAAHEQQLQEVEARWEKARQELHDVEARVEAERAALAARAVELQQEVDALEELRTDRRARLLAELLGPGRAAPEPPAAAPVRAAPIPLRVRPTLPEVLAELQQVLGAWTHEEVANLLLTVLTCRWTLLAGPPGVGKSTFARGLLAALGHGPGTPRYLELVVRHEWQDDAPLFGFWHPDRGVWVPSSEGFVEHLLRAAHDGEEDLGGLYTVVLEELNLASPEYYLARPISAFEAELPRIRLYGEDVRPHNHAVYPATLGVGDNVRLVGTVNVDDTVQRLSPRFLSRAAVIWMEPSLETLYEAAPPLPRAAAAVDWPGLARAAQASRGRVPASIQKVINLLHEKRVPGAPNPRALRGIEAWLGAAEGLLPPTVAADLQVCQRVLPALRGVGSDMRTRLDELADVLRAQQMPRAAARIQRLRERGEALGDYYDMFHV